MYFSLRENVAEFGSSRLQRSNTNASVVSDFNNTVFLQN
jgi:hypothetical protein